MNTLKLSKIHHLNESFKILIDFFSSLETYDLEILSLCATSRCGRGLLPPKPYLKQMIIRSLGLKRLKIFLFNFTIKKNANQAIL